MRKKRLIKDVTKENPSFARGHNFYKAVWIFVIGCLVGCIWEVLIAYIQTGSWVSRSGLIYGPFTPVYGIGALVYMYALDSVTDTIKLFFLSCLLGGFSEWICSYLQELLFGTISWDYHHYFLNIGGRTSLFHMIAWGIIGVIYIKYILPFLSNWIEKIPNWIGPTITLIVAGLMFIDIFLSFTAATRQTERVQKLPPANKFEEYIDKKYPDEFMDKIYANKKQTKKASSS